MPATCVTLLLSSETMHSKTLLQTPTEKTLDQTLQVPLSHLVPITTDVNNAVVDTRKPSLMGNEPWISKHALRRKHLYLTLSC